jgi:hypothetical protein
MPIKREITAMATDKDYKNCGLTTRGVKNARRIDDWLELIVDELTELCPPEPCGAPDPWEVRDFLARCVDATALSDVRTRAYLAKKYS